MQTRTQLRKPQTIDPMFHAAAIPLLEAGDLPGDDDWSILGSIRYGDDDGDTDFTLAPDFD